MHKGFLESLGEGSQGIESALLLRASGKLDESGCDSPFLAKAGGASSPLSSSPITSPSRLDHHEADQGNSPTRKSAITVGLGESP